MAKGRGEMKRVNFQIPAVLYDWIVEQAAAHGVSMAAFLTMRVAELKRQEEVQQVLPMVEDILHALKSTPSREG